MAVQFTKATKQQAKARLCLDGPAGSGKSYSSLAIATALGGKIAVIDTEHGSASKYAGQFAFDTLALTSYHPERYIEGIHAAEEAGYDILIIDSLSHAWTGKDGALELKDRASARQGENSFTAWRHVTPLHNALVDAILACRMHVICTMRTKTEYVIETVPGKGQVPRKIGMAPIQRDGVEYEFDVVGDLNIDHEMAVSKTRCPELDGQVFKKPGADVAGILSAWLSDGTPPPPPAPKALVTKVEKLLDELTGENGQREKALDKIQVDYGVRDLARLTKEQAEELQGRFAEAKAKLAEKAAAE